jgi:hypothetical protein
MSLVRPRWLADLTSRQELGHHRLDVQDRRPVDRVEPHDREHAPFPAGDLDDAAPQAVRTVLAPLGEDADAGPRLVAARMSRAPLDGGLRDAVEVKEYLGVREGLDAVETLRSEGLVELDAGSDSSPVVVAEVVARAAHAADRRQRDHRVAPAVSGAA